MKKLLTIILIGIVGYGIWYGLKAPTLDPNNSNPSVTKGLSRPDISNATFKFEDSSITLRNGVSEQPITPGSTLTQETILTDMIEFGDLNADAKEDAVGIVVQLGGGSGVFIYLVAQVSGLVEYKGSNAVFIGNRIDPKSISIEDGLITLTYLDRKPGEAFAAEPTVSTTKQFIYKNGELVKK